MFNARGGKKEIIEILASYGIEPSADDPVIERIVSRAAQDAIIPRGIFPSHIYALYLRETGRIEGPRIEIIHNDEGEEGKGVKITFILDNETFTLQGVGSGDNGIIDGCMQAINAFFEGKRIFDIKEYTSSSRLSANTIARNLRTQGLGIPDISIEGDPSGSRAYGISECILRDSGGRCIYTRAAHHDADRASILALITGVLPAIVQTIEARRKA